MARRLLFAVLVALVGATLSFGQVPRLISFQGVLTDDSGKPISTGTYHLTLRLYGSATGGEPIWQEEQSAVVTDGILNLLLGGVTPLQLPFDRPYWLGITVGSGAEMTPRIPLTSTGYAVRAVYADSITGIAAGGDLTGSYPNPVLRDSSVTEAKIADGAVTQQKLAPDVSLPPGGPAGGDLKGSYPNPVLRDSCVTTSKIADGAVTAAKLAPDASLPPGGTAGGDLAGSYPNPQIAPNAVDSSKIADRGISADDVNFPYAGSDRRGGPAKDLMLPFSGSAQTSQRAAFKISNYGGGNALWGHSQGGLGVYGFSIDSIGVVGASYYQSGVYGLNTYLHNYGYLGGSYAVYGSNGFSYNWGYIGAMDEAVYGRNAKSQNEGRLATEKEGVFGTCKAHAGAGVKGLHSSTGNYGLLGTKSAGVFGAGNSGDGVHGHATNGRGVYGLSFQNYGVLGESQHNIGVRGKNLGSGNYGELGTSQYGLQAYGSTQAIHGNSPNVAIYGRNTVKNTVGYLASSSYGVYGGTPPGFGYAGYFSGRVQITGDLAVTGTKSFRIDHPLDPEGKYLQHYCLESDEVLNVYSGNVILDASGEAEVQLPDWFEAINGDFRYQLTCVGGYAPVYIAEKISGNRFRIAGGRPGLEVSWQVTAVRQDRWVKAHPPQVEIAKPPEEQGYYLQPELYGQPEERSVEWARNPELMRVLQQERQNGPGTPGPEGRK